MRPRWSRTTLNQYQPAKRRVLSALATITADSKRMLKKKCASQNSQEDSVQARAANYNKIVISCVSILRSAWVSCYGVLCKLLYFDERASTCQAQNPEMFLEMCNSRLDFRTLTIA